MSEAAIFISWGQPVYGREKRAARQMRESIACWRRLKDEKRIEAVEWATLPRQGGRLWGIGLLRGIAKQIGALRQTEGFARWIVRVGLVCEDVSVIDANVDEIRLERGLDLYDDLIKDFAEERSSSNPASGVPMEHGDHLQ